MKVVQVGQCVRHAAYGVGIATRSDENRTTIDFYEHGVKTFVTDIWAAELIKDAPPRPGRSGARASRAKAAKS